MVSVNRPGDSGGGQGLGQVMSLFNMFGGNKSNSVPSVPGAPGTDPTGAGGSYGLGGQGMVDQLGNGSNDLQNQMDMTNAMLRKKSAMVSAPKSGGPQGLGSVVGAISEL